MFYIALNFTASDIYFCCDFKNDANHVFECEVIKRKEVDTKASFKTGAFKY